MRIRHGDFKTSTMIDRNKQGGQVDPSDRSPPVPTDNLDAFITKFPCISFLQPEHSLIRKNECIFNQFIFCNELMLNRKAFRMAGVDTRGR